MKVKPKDKKVCRFLNAKNSFGMLDGGDNQWFGIDDANTQYWCIRSSGGAGPDNGLVGRAQCVKGRSCFKD